MPKDLYALFQRRIKKKGLELPDKLNHTFQELLFSIGESQNVRVFKQEEANALIPQFQNAVQGLREDVERTREEVKRRFMGKDPQAYAILSATNPSVEFFKLLLPLPNDFYHHPWIAQTGQNRKMIDKHLIGTLIDLVYKTTRKSIESGLEKLWIAPDGKCRRRAEYMYDLLNAENAAKILYDVTKSEEEREKAFLEMNSSSASARRKSLDYREIAAHLYAQIATFSVPFSLSSSMNLGRSPYQNLLNLCKLGVLPLDFHPVRYGDPQQPLQSRFLIDVLIKGGENIVWGLYFEGDEKIDYRHGLEEHYSDSRAAHPEMPKREVFPPPLQVYRDRGNVRLLVNL